MAENILCHKTSNDTNQAPKKIKSAVCKDSFSDCCAVEIIATFSLQDRVFHS